ncbi:copper amine oxidase N-terminal domain-containing protein, partial [Vibrio parahaemolyticus]|nr:copper amine oxidase N-terminal domain-containing protein [Vibrio parahaemolyticus]
GETTATVNGVKTPMDVQDGKVVDTKALLLKDRTYVPLRFVAEALGATIDYQRGLKVNIIDIKTPNPDTTPEKLPFPEPYIITVFYPQTRGAYGNWFRIELRNVEEYKDLGLNVTTKLIGGDPDWLVYKKDDFTTAKKGDYVIIDNIEKYSNRTYDDLRSARDLYRFDINVRSLKLNSTKDERVALPKEGDILVFQIDFTANGYTKTYFHKVRIREDVKDLFAEDGNMNFIPWDEWAYSAQKNKK